MIQVAAQAPCRLYEEGGRSRGAGRLTLEPRAFRALVVFNALEGRVELGGIGSETGNGL